MLIWGGAFTVTDELTQKRQPAARMQNKKTAAARPAVGFPVERRVRPHSG